MNTIRIRYKGGRSLNKQHWNRVAYVFKKETDYIADVPEGLAKQLILTGNFEVVPIEIKEVIKEVPKEAPKEVERNLTCKLCGFEAKSEQGLLVHSATKHKSKK